MPEVTISGEEIVDRTASDFGGSSHVTLPKTWRGADVKVVRMNESANQEPQSDLNKDNLLRGLEDDMPLNLLVHEVIEHFELLYDKMGVESSVSSQDIHTLLEDYVDDPEDIDIALNELKAEGSAYETAENQFRTT